MDERFVKFLRTFGMLIGILYGAIFLSASFLAVSGGKLDFSFGYFDFAYIMFVVGVSLFRSFKEVTPTE